MTKPIVLVENLVKTFTRSKGWFSRQIETVTAVNGLSFSVQPGEILGLLGSNGAGKTTTLQMLLSITEPSSGSITYFGKNLYTHRSEILSKVSFASTYIRLPSILSIYENLTIIAKLYGLPAKEYIPAIKELLTRFSMWEMRHRICGALSAGETTRVMIIKAFLTKPDIVLLDEPTAALDPNIAESIRSFIAEQNNELGTTILLTSHNMAEVAELCNRVLVMKNGTIIADNCPKALAQSLKDAHVTFVISDGLKRLKAFLEKNNMGYLNHERVIELQIPEQQISNIFIAMAKQDIIFSHVTVEKPTLEDYFKHITQP